jgi:hypothetical protein
LDARLVEQLPSHPLAGAVTLQVAATVVGTSVERWDPKELRVGKNHAATRGSVDRLETALVCKVVASLRSYAWSRRRAQSIVAASNNREDRRVRCACGAEASPCWSLGIPGIDANCCCACVNVTWGTVTLEMQWLHGSGTRANIHANDTRLWGQWSCGCNGGAAVALQQTPVRERNDDGELSSGQWMPADCRSARRAVERHAFRIRAMHRLDCYCNSRSPHRLFATSRE